MKPIYRLAIPRFGEMLRRNFGVIWLAAGASYLAVSAGQAVYRNYQSQKETLQLENQYKEQVIERQRLESLLVYYQTESFKEKELRRALLLKLPGEQVFALPEYSFGTVVDQEQKITPATHTITHPFADLPTWKQWFYYLMNRDS